MAFCLQSFYKSCDVHRHTLLSNLWLKGSIFDKRAVLTTCICHKGCTSTVFGSAPVGIVCKAFLFTVQCGRQHSLQWNIDCGGRCFRLCVMCHSAVDTLLPSLYSIFTLHWMHVLLILFDYLLVKWGLQRKYYVFLYFNSYYFQEALLQVYWCCCYQVAWRKCTLKNLNSSIIFG